MGIEFLRHQKDGTEAWFEKDEAAILIRDEHARWTSMRPDLKPNDRILEHQRAKAMEGMLTARRIYVSAVDVTGIRREVWLVGHDDKIWIRIGSEWYPAGSDYTATGDELQELEGARRMALFL